MSSDAAAGEFSPQIGSDKHRVSGTMVARLREHLPPLRPSTARDMIVGDPAVLRIALLCLALDVAFIAVHIVRALSDTGEGPTLAMLADERWSILKDWGYAEMHNYVKIALVCFCLLASFRNTRAPIYLAWAIVFVIVLMDDALLVHESLGPMVADLAGFGPFAGLPGHHFGELAVWGTMGTIAMIALFLGFKGSRPPHTRWGVVLSIIFAGLVFAGVVVDAFTVALKGEIRGLGVVEDGGELLMVSLALIVSFLNWRRMTAVGEAGSSANG